MIGQKREGGQEPMKVDNDEIAEGVADIRAEYAGQKLDPSSVPEDPLTLFGRWFEQAREQCVEPNAMVLSTVNSGSGVSSRVVLLKGLDERGFTFYTNYRSAKGKELQDDPRAALNFFWPQLHRQVRVEGKVARIAAAESDEYFASRPADSQLGAWASPQSEEIDGRAAIEKALEERAAEFEGKLEIPRPPHWGGFRLVPVVIEFWQGQPSRLHDRVVYRCGKGRSWDRARLAP